MHDEDALLLNATVPAGLRRVVEELIPAACHVTEQYANNVVEADHGRLKARLRPMRGVKRLRSARVISARHAFIQNLRPRTRREYRPTASAHSDLHRTRPRHLIEAAQRKISSASRLRNCEDRRVPASGRGLAVRIAGVPLQVVV